MPTTPFLDDQAALAKLDESNALGSIEQLGSQIQQIWDIAQDLHFDASYQDINLVVVAGMGGSSLGTHVIQSVFKEELTVPVIIAPDYTVPNYVGPKTLVIASSYSGTTEETLAAVADAEQKGAKIAGITSGGTLATWLKERHYPALVFEPKFNPCNQPRMALGYSVFGQIALFARAGILKVTDQDFQAVLDAVAEAHLISSANVDQNSNPAKLLAYELKDRIPVVVVAEHLEGVGHVFANQLNENAKNYSEFRVIPELNHHLMEGLKFPESNESNLCFFMAKSKLYNDHNRRRFELTADVLDQNQIEVREFELTSQSKLTQAFELMVFGAYANYYLAMLNNVNPSPIPWVDWFKAQLKKS